MNRRSNCTRTSVGALLVAMVLVLCGSGCASAISDMVLGRGTVDSIKQESQSVKLDTEPRQSAVVDPRDGSVLGTSPAWLSLDYTSKETRQSSCGWRAAFGVVDVIVGGAVAAASTYGLISYELSHQDQSSTDAKGIGIMAAGLFGAIAGGVDLVFGGYHAADACRVRKSVPIPRTHPLRLRFDGEEAPFTLTVPAVGPQLVYLGMLDEKAWAKAARDDNAKAYEGYLEEFPTSGKWRKQAELRLEEISWEAASAQGTPDAFMDHLKKYPEGAHHGQAAEALAQFLRSAPEKLDVNKLEWLLERVESLQQLVALELISRGASERAIAEQLENPFVAERDRRALLAALKTSVESGSRKISEYARATLCRFASSDRHLHTSWRCRRCTELFRLQVASGGLSAQFVCTDSSSLVSLRNERELEEFLAGERQRDRTGCEHEWADLRAKEKELRAEALRSAGTCP
jgi:hypothetical protein